MPGAGSLKAVNYLFNVAPRDGTVIGASGGGAESDVFANVLRKLFRLPLRIVTGYPGGTEIILAMERHEVDGRCGWSWTSLVARNKAMLDAHEIAVTLQIALAHFAPGVLFEPLLGHAEGAQFDATKFTWLGSASREASVCAFIAGAGIKSWADMRSKPTIIGASGGGAESDVFPTVLRNMFHLPLKIVTGYPGGTEITLAMERHEVDGRCGWSWTSLLSRSKALLDSHQLDVVLQIALQKTKDLPDVPLIVDVTDNAEQKAALKLIVARQSIARPFAAPPGIPAERARALREAFAATLADPEFLADAKSQSLDIEAVQGAEVEALIREVYASSPQAVQLATAALREIKE